MNRMAHWSEIRCRLGTYGMVPPPKLKLIGWLQQFIYMLKLGSSSNFALSACFDEIFQLSVLITDEHLVWLSCNFRCSMAIYGMVLPPKMKLIRWIKQFPYMLKNRYFCILAYFDVTFELWTLIIDERLDRLS